MKTTTDKFLDGRIAAKQPINGYRAATDPVLLAASVDISLGRRVLDVGCGVGVASLCLAARLPDVEISGLEIQDLYARLASQNASANNVNLAVHHGDLNALPIALKDQVFDQVITNPPFHRNKSVSQNAGKALADHETLGLSKWIALSLRRVRPHGYFTIIHMAEVLPDILQALDNCGDIRILPFAPRRGQMANRVLVRARKLSKTPARLLPPFIMHRGKAHDVDGDSYTKQAKKILRDAAPLQI
ncbi:methyltransferase [Amylibacter ulvae]|uniref:Methyltransferase n=1 Tax=Paramylibacter ulvae TaxID=1651968 RepID=A0ABQ3D4N0_9RHOB|nr:methyltransferase [Amylibacter ulvae]GHA56496.1 methyltransferase [Amylibacter ulvae]